MSPERANPRPPVTPQPTGFTLVELLVVIFIISLLVAVVLTVIPKVKTAVYKAETEAQLSALATAIQQYYNDYKSYPGPLANNQLNWSYDSVTANQPIAYGDLLQGSQPFTASSETAYNPPASASFSTNITGAQNLVLGLLGGLELTTNPAVTGFVYNPQDIFSDGVTPAPKGPASLNYSSPKRQQAYIQVRPGDLSTPSTAYNGGSGASFADDAGRSPKDAMIPVFLDKFSSPLPILYYRTNVGGAAVVGFRSSGIYKDDSGQIVASGAMGQTYPTPQYDLDQNLAYVQSTIGTIASNPNSHHGLIGVGTSTNLSDPIDVRNPDGTYSPSNTGKNGLAYFKDPSNPTYDSTVDTMASNTPSNTFLTTPRQKDGFLLISAGADRLYGTHDDNVHPGPLVP